MSWALGTLHGPAFAEVIDDTESRGLQFQLFNSQYLSDAQNETQTESYSSLSLRFQHGRERVRSLYGWDFMGLASVDGSEQAYFAVPELYWGFRPNGDPRLKVVFGRQAELWSRFDREWRLGIWQPYVRWDYLNPRSQGLTGVFIKAKTPDFSYTMFASPLFIPDQGPNFTVVNGEFRSTNRWFRQPQSRHQVLQQDRPLNYELNRPSVDKIVNHPSFGVAVQLGNELLGPWLQISVANKPMNQLHLGIEGYHSISRFDRYLESVAVVHPLVARHTVTTVEAGYHEENFNTWISLTEERPERPDVPEEWEEGSLFPTQFMGASFSHRLPWDGWRNHWFKYSAMHTKEDVPPVKGGVMSDSLESSLDRYPYQDVLSFEWVAPILDRSRRRLDIGLRYLYSVPEKGSLLSAKMELLLNQNTRWDLGFDILGAQVDPADPKSGLMSRYRNNDRVMGGLTYVF